jgi:hypothetical protein
MELHGHAKDGVGTPTYQSWRGMIGRCCYSKHPYFHRYGGRGITVCDHWLFFENFLADMGERPKGLTFDRRDQEKGYEPSNCRWATRKEQARHSRRLAMFNGKPMSRAEIAVELGIGEGALYYRLSTGSLVLEAV